MFKEACHLVQPLNGLVLPLQAETLHVGQGAQQQLAYRGLQQPASWKANFKW